MDEGNEVFPPPGSAALVVIEFPSFRDFIDAYSPIISEEGIFIRNADVSESNAFSVGDQVEFEVRLKDDFRLIQGAGEVVWLGDSEAAGGASGTAIRFHDVDEPSQRLISRLVGNYVNDGGKLFEVGGGVVEVVAEDVVGEEAELLVAPLDEPTELPDVPLDSQEITAETLRASEAETLFAADAGAERTTPLEFESVSVDDVEPNELQAEGAEAPSFGPDDPVGLETIAIPSGLVAKLASEAAQTQEADGASEADATAAAADAADATDDGAVEADASVEMDAAAGTAATADAADAADLELGAIDATADEFDPERIELPPVAEPPGADAVLAAAKGAASVVAPDHFDVPLSDDFDDASLAAAAGAMDANLGVGGAFPGGIAEVAEELSGVHRIEMPDPEETSGVTYAGSASVRPERSTGGRIAALVVAAMLLGAGAFYFQDSIRGFLGLGDGADGAVSAELVQVREAMPTVDRAPVGKAGETTPTVGDPDGDGADTGAIEAGDNGTAGDSMAEDATAGAETAAQGSQTSLASGTGGETAAVRESAEPAAPVAATQAVTPAAATDQRPEERRVERITWREEGNSTIVTIRLNTELSKAYLEAVRVREGAPREVIKIQGVNVPYSPSEVAIGSSHLLRLRTGLHQEGGGSVLHVVADLADAGVALVSIEPRGRDLEITFSSSRSVSAQPSQLGFATR